MKSIGAAIVLLGAVLAMHFPATAAASAAETSGVCNDGCEVVYLVVSEAGAVGERVVRDTLGRCWRDTFVEEATDDPAIKSIRPVSPRIQVQCGKV